VALEFVLRTEGGSSNVKPRAAFAIDRPIARYSNASSAGTPNAFLIWAVTGAGKTEMIFPLLAAALAYGGTALVATPRKDVVLELSPRVQLAFPSARVVTLYGGSEQRWDNGDIVIATTHQLMRFRERFDVVVIDELDAFPFHNSPTLAFAARKACKPSGRYVLLSATPPIAMRRAAERGRLPHVKVPARYHRHPLPMPRLYESKSLQEMLSARKLTRSLLHCVRQSLGRGAQLFVFVPAIAQVGPLVLLLQRSSPGLVVRGTSSKDPARAEKVQAFRDGHIRLLVTTTILERGVTVPKSDVIVLDADSRLFDEASLVQMAGRAGRSKLDPNGSVAFIAKDRTRSQLAATRHIRRMNRLARKKGYLG
jgi:competence protein ComFA